MKIIRVTTKEKPILDYLEDAWVKPDDQDLPTADIIKWLRQNIHRRDIGLWVAMHEGQIVGCLMAIGPSLIFPSVHIYVAWRKKDAPVKTKDFFEGPFIDWIRSLGCNEISMCSTAHSGRAWQRRWAFQPYGRIYRRSLEPIGEIPAKIKETDNASTAKF